MNAIVNELNAAGPGPIVTNPPVTQAPVTQAPVTQAPVTQAPVTQAPITQAPVTQAPVTQAPVTQAPVTQAPVTQAPVTQAPSSGGVHHDIVHVTSSQFDCSSRADGYYSDPASCEKYYICAATMTFHSSCHPGLHFNAATNFCDFGEHVQCGAKQPAVTQAPVTAAPVTQAPVTQKPVTQAPVTQAPVTQAPITQAPVTQAPITQAPVTQAPGPVTMAPITQAPNVPAPGEFCKGKADGFYKDPKDCAYFFQCSFELAYHEPCPSGTKFSTALQGCAWEANVKDCP